MNFNKIADTSFRATKIIGRRKAFYRQSIPEFGWARKETVDIDILVTSRNVDRKIMQSIRITSRPTFLFGLFYYLSSFMFRWKFHPLLVEIAG